MRNSNGDLKQNGNDKKAGRAYHYACRLLARRDYTAHEVRSKLLGKKYTTEVVEATIEKFTKLGFLNDTDFVGKYVRTRVLLKPRGEYLLRMELKKKGVSKELLDEYFAENALDEVAITKSLLAGNSRKLMRLDPQKRREKIHNLLRSKGLSARLSGGFDF